MSVFVYMPQSKQVCDPDHLKVFATWDAADAWFAEDDPEGADECIRIISTESIEGRPVCE